MHPTAKVSEHVRMKCPPLHNFTTFNPLHRLYPPNSCTIDVAAIKLKTCLGLFYLFLWFHF